MNKNVWGSLIDFLIEVDVASFFLLWQLNLIDFILLWQEKLAVLAIIQFK